MRYSEIRAAVILSEYETRADRLVYHGSKTPSIKHFEKRAGTRAAWFDTKTVQSNGFFFALTAEDAASFGPYVSSYRIKTASPLVFGTDGVDGVGDPKRRADIRYVTSADATYTSRIMPWCS